MSLLANLPDRLPGRILDQRCRRRRVGPGILSGSHLRGPAHHGRGEAVAKLEHNAIAVCDGDAGADTRIRTRRRRRPARPAAEVHAPENVFGIDSMAEAAHAAVRLGALRPLLVPGSTLDLDTPPTAPPPARQAAAQHHGVTPLQALRPGVVAPVRYRAAPPASRVAVAIAARRACGPPLTPESLRPLTAQRHGQAQQPLPAHHTPLNRAMLH